ncbi:hypothetical protein pb186bvf_003228 [Paramecium bursaria]
MSYKLIKFHVEDDLFYCNLLLNLMNIKNKPLIRGLNLYALGKLAIYEQI